MSSPLTPEKQIPYSLIHLLVTSIPKWVNKVEYTRTGEICIEIESEYVREFFTYLRDHSNLQVAVLIDVTAVDYPTREKRFEVVYHLLSVAFNQRFRVKTSVGDGESLSSIQNIYRAAGWFEREVWDLFGIYFFDHTDLRRILTDYGFHGHPMRKDFPLTGFVQVYYDEEEKRVQMEPTEVSQDFRYFSFEDAWKMD